MKITLRHTERNAYCRGCDGLLARGTLAVYTYSYRNRGQHIFFCMSCAKQIGVLGNLQMDLNLESS